MFFESSLLANKFTKDIFMYIHCNRVIFCHRWLHGSCDGLVNEEELDRAADYGYHCLYCRPKTKQTLVGVSGMSCRTPSASHPFFSFLSSAGTNTLHG